MRTLTELFDERATLLHVLKSDAGRVIGIHRNTAPRVIPRSLSYQESEMAITNKQSGTNVHEVADGIYRISTPVSIAGGGFSFNQYLMVDDEPLIFHTGPRKMFPLVREAVASVLPPQRLRHIAFSHVEADECGSLNEWLAVAPQSAPLCGTVAALVSINDLADRSPRALADGECFKILNDKLGGGCRTVFNCTEAYPRDIKITKAIAEVKRALTTGRID